MDYRDQIQEILLGRSIVEAAREELALWVEGFQAVQEAYRSALRGFEEEEDKLAKVLENPSVIRTPIVRNGKQSTIGYQPEVWKGWN